MSKYSGNAPKAGEARDNSKHPHGGIWNVLRAQAKNTETELLHPDVYGKGAGVRDCLMNPRDIYAGLDKLLFQ